MEAVILLVTGISGLVWLMLQVPTRKSTPELYKAYRRKSTLVSSKETASESK